MIIWPQRNVAVEYISDPSRTASGGWVRDSYGTTWKIVDAFGPQGTCDRRATIDQNGVIHER